MGVLKEAIATGLEAVRDQRDEEYEDLHNLDGFKYTSTNKYEVRLGSVRLRVYASKRRWQYYRDGTDWVISVKLHLASRGPSGRRSWKTLTSRNTQNWCAGQFQPDSILPDTHVSRIANEMVDEAFSRYKSHIGWDHERLQKVQDRLDVVHEKYEALKGLEPEPPMTRNRWGWYSVVRQ